MGIVSGIMGLERRLGVVALLQFLFLSFPPHPSGVGC